MLVSGDWITPHYDNLTYLDKPAVFFWLVAASFRLWGVSEWAARFPSALAALGTTLLTWLLARRMFGHATGIRAGFILLTSPLVLVISRLAIFDMTFTFLVTLAMASFWLAEAGESPRAWPEAAMFAAMGAATITKGPVGFLVPLLSVVAYQTARGRIRELARLRWGVGLCAFLAVALPWFVAVSLRNPDFPRYAFWQESLARFATSHARRAGSVLYYVPVYMAGFFPWSFFLLFAGWHRVRQWRELNQDTHKPVAFLLAWAGVIFVFFSISQSKLPAYFLPAIIPLSILMARAWAEAGSAAPGRPPDWLTAGFACLVGLGLIVAVASRFLPSAAFDARLAKKLHPTVLGMIKPSLLYTGLILAALAMVGRDVAARARGVARSAATFALLALVTPFLMLRWLAPIKTFAATVSSRRLAATILRSPEKNLPIYGYYYFRTSLPFYLRRPVGLVTADASELTSNYVAMRWEDLRRRASAEKVQPRSSPDGELASGTLVTDARALASGSEAGPVLVVVRNTHVGSLRQAVGEIEPLWEEWDYSVWKIPGSKSETGK